MLNYGTVIITAVFDGGHLASILTTINVMTWTVLISTVIGFVLAVVMNVTKEDGLHPNRYVSQALDFLINLIRSFPFVILMVSLIPVTRFVTVPPSASRPPIFPLCITMAPYMGRLIQSHMEQVSKETIEAAKSFGASTFQIIWHVDYRGVHPRHLLCHLLCHSGRPSTPPPLPAWVGAGGLGNVAIRYGYNNFNDTIMYSTVAILVVLVQLIQFVGNTVYKKLK